MARAEFFFFTTVLASCWPSLEGADLFEPVNQTYKRYLPKMIFKCYDMVLFFFNLFEQ